MTDHSETADNREPTEQKELTENTDPNEPIDPIDSAEPIDPMDRIEPLEAIERNESFEAIDHFEPRRPHPGTPSIMDRRAGARRADAGRRPTRRAGARARRLLAPCWLRRPGR